MVKDAVYTGQHWAAKQTSKVRSPGDRRQKNRAGGRRGELSPALPPKTAGREQHRALRSGGAEVGRGWATYRLKVAPPSENGPSSEVFQQSAQQNCSQHCSALGRAGTEASLIHNLPCAYICVIAAMNSISSVLQETICIN